MARPLLLYRNLADAAAVTAAHEVSTLPASFLQQSHLGKVWRTPDATTASAIIVDLGAATAISCVALFGLNLSAAGAARVKLSSVDGTGSAEIHDSGALTPAGVDPDYETLLHVLTADLSARWVRVELDDGSLPYLEAGRVVVGPAWRMTRGRARTGHERFSVDPSIVDRAIGGAAWVEEMPVRRGVRMPLEGVTTAELQTHLDPLARHAGRHSDVLLCLDHEAANVGRETYWGLMTEPPLMGQRGLSVWRQHIEVIAAA